MVDSNNIQIPQDLIKIDIDYNPDLLRKTITDMLTLIKDLEDRIKVLEDAV